MNRFSSEQKSLQTRQICVEPAKGEKKGEAGGGGRRSLEKHLLCRKE